MIENHRLRMLEITKQLEKQGVGAYTAAPPIYRLAWRMGFRLRPPLYQDFIQLSFGLGAWFALTWGLFMWLLIWREEGISVTSAVVASIFAGLLFGLSMAAYYRWKAARVQLPSLNGGSHAA